jgi:hypothetical protein
MHAAQWIVVFLFGFRTLCALISQMGCAPIMASIIWDAMIVIALICGGFFG